MSSTTGSLSESYEETVSESSDENTSQTDNLDLNDYSNYGDNKSNEEYYKRVIPGYSGQINQVTQVNRSNAANTANKPYYNNVNYNLSESPIQSQDVLLQKLNYMITLLEDQQDERTNNVTEEVVLYSFLGIFIIFIVDSFSRVGKYVR